jgi:hypothetical protein
MAGDGTSLEARRGFIAPCEIVPHTLRQVCCGLRKSPDRSGVGGIDATQQSQCASASSGRRQRTFNPIPKGHRGFESHLALQSWAVNQLGQVLDCNPR